MNRKDLIYNKLSELADENGIDAQTLASLLNISRANVSHELNNLCKEGKVYKSSGRPVLFSVSKNNTSVTSSKLDALLKNNISLKLCIEQAKAAILYPPKGMPCLIFGETGVGKSMFASLMHDYAVEMSVKKETSPFIAFNCADYSNNPQLLTSQLFGVKKGTYTGADSDKAGLIEKANGGILFLDEVHRLPPEGQEALFTFLDTGTFRRMGDYEIRTSDVLIVSATTEDPRSSLLKTFTRRIPMTIVLPSLKDRTFEERLYLVRSFFKHESIRLNKCIYVSLNTMRAFLSYDCTNNIGQLKSDVQLVCAKAYSEFLTNIKYDVRITSSGLPQYIKDGLYKEKEHRVLWNKLVGDDIEFFKFSNTDDSTENLDKDDENGIYEIMEKKIERLKAKGISDIEIENFLEKDISKYFEKYISGVSEEINKKNLLNILGIDVLNLIDKVIFYITSYIKRGFNNNMYTALALHIDTLIKRVQNNKKIINPQLNKIKQLYPEEFKIALEVKEIIEAYVHEAIPEDEAGFLTIFLLPEEKYLDKSIDKVKVLLIAHGSSTASSMADVANKLLGEDYAIGINAPLELSPFEVLKELRTVVKQNFSTSGFLLLVDMGSLTTFAETIEKEFRVPVKVIPLASTLHVIEAARKALLGHSLDVIYKEILSINSYMEMNRAYKEPISGNKKITIIATCLTGEGGSAAVKSFLNTNLKYDKDMFEIITMNCLDRKYFEKELAKIEQDREILFIVSSFDFTTKIKQYSMSDVLSMKVINELQEIIDTKTALYKMKLILKENIDNLDGEELYDNITQFIKRIELELNITLSDDRLIGLILHISFMLSRTKKGDVSIAYPEKETFIENNFNLYDVIKENFIFLYNKYYLEISEDEICYLINFFK